AHYTGNAGPADHPNESRTLTITSSHIRLRCPSGYPPLQSEEPSLHRVRMTAAGDMMISPLPVTLVEGRRRAQWCPPGTTDSLGARKAKVLHQVNQVVAQLKIRRHPVDRFYAHHLDLRQSRCCRSGRPHRRRLLRMRMCCKRPCRSQPSKQTDELVPPHSITSSARASSLSGICRPSAFAVFVLMISSYLVGCRTGRSAGRSPLRMRPV